jgi:type IV secretion system protein VirB5
MAGQLADISPQAKTVELAKRQFVEIYGSSLAMTRYLRLALVLTALVALGLLALNFRTQAHYANLRPLVIRIDDVGRAEAVAYDATTYRPQAPELRYFLTRFVATHFSRVRTTVQRDYPDSLYFLAPALADSAMAQNDRTRAIETFVTTPSEDEIEVEVRNVTLSDLRASPFRASVDFDKAYIAPGSRHERRRETFVLQAEFMLRESVPNAFVPVNPLGLQITYFRVDQAFK